MNVNILPSTDHDHGITVNDSSNTPAGEELCLQQRAIESSIVQHQVRVDTSTGTVCACVPAGVSPRQKTLKTAFMTKN